MSQNCTRIYIVARCVQTQVNQQNQKNQNQSTKFKYPTGPEWHTEQEGRVVGNGREKEEKARLGR